MEPTVHDVLTFHRIDRAAYERLLALGAGRQPARDAVALLMWLHRSACARVDVVSRVPALVRDPASAVLLVAEVRAVLDGTTSPCARTSTETPLLSFLYGDDGVHVRRLLASCSPDAPRRGVAEILHGVGALVFDDRLHELVRRHEADRGGSALPAELAAPYRRCGTAAAAREEEHGRSLFITFSKGFPLTREEIIDFFTERWGADCVARVMMEKTPPGEPPTYGRIVLRQAATAAAVLGGRSLVKLVVNGRHLWARKYVPRF